MGYSPWGRKSWTQLSDFPSLIMNRASGDHLPKLLSRMACTSGACHGEMNPESSSKSQRSSHIFKIVVLIYFSHLLPDATYIDIGQISPHQSSQWTLLGLKNDPCMLPFRKQQRGKTYKIFIYSTLNI